MNIDELSGKALGIEVAKWVMGWDQWPIGVSMDDIPSGIGFTDFGDDYLTVWLPNHGRWAPWRDMNHCWEVVPEMAKHRLYVSIHHNGNQYAAQWDVRFIDYDDVMRRSIAICETVNEAILRAALKAKGGEGCP